MPLKITRSTDPIEVKTIVLALYGGPGVGKTSMVFTTKCLLLDCDHGIHRSRNRKDAVVVERWEDIENLTADDFKGYTAVALDTGGRAVDMLANKLIADDAKNGKPGSGLSLPGFGVLKARFAAWLKHVRSFGLDVILIFHADEQRKGEEVIVRLDMQGSSKQEVYKSADAMGHIYFEKNKRMLNFSPTETAFGKNPGGLEPEEVPDYTQVPDYLAQVIAKTKAAMNEMSAEQKETAEALGVWRERIDAASSLDDFDKVYTAAKEAPKNLHANIKAMMVKAAKAEGYVFNAKTGYFDMAEKKGEKKDTKKAS